MAVSPDALPSRRQVLLAGAAALPWPAAAAVPAQDDAPPPLYPVQLPPPGRLQYALRRGMLGGSGELAWRPDGLRYRMTMTGTALSLRLIGWTSEGRLGEHGLAPDRFVDERRGRPARIAEFRRDRAVVGFSDPSLAQVELPLLPGTQDRLSWMLQMPAIVAARPAAWPPGAALALNVVGARGDGDVWRFQVVAAEGVRVPAGPVASALHLHRLARKPNDTSVDVWLDPARAHLPVLVRLAEHGDEEPTEFALRELLPR